MTLKGIRRIGPTPSKPAVRIIRFAKQIARKLQPYWRPLHGRYSDPRRLSIPRERACEGIDFFVGEGYRGVMDEWAPSWMNPVRVKRSLGAALSRRERALGIGPQASGGEEIIRERMPERMAFALMTPRTGGKPKPWFLRSVLIRSMRLRKAYTALPASLAIHSRHALTQAGCFSRLRMRRARLAGLTLSRSSGAVYRPRPVPRYERRAQRYPRL